MTEPVSRIDENVSEPNGARSIGAETDASGPNVSEPNGAEPNASGPSISEPNASEPNGQPAGGLKLTSVSIASGALKEVGRYIERMEYRSVVLAVDDNTYEAAGRQLGKHLDDAGVSTAITRFKPDRSGDVLADEAALVQLLLELQRTAAELVIAVGGGTIHDIVRFCAYTANIPFVSVPTAPSVDGFNSKGAPIITRGVKVTVPAISPAAVFADLDVLVKAPPRLAAAGFGDMLGKYTSLFDWQFGAMTAGEPYLQRAADMTRSALARCVNQAEQIARRDEEGIFTLMSALLESGFAMMLFGRSHPASGAEHHLSHYWEMDHIRLGRRQLLHGAKVGVASVEISRLYHKIAEEGAARWHAVPSISEHWEAIASLIAQIPQERTLVELLRQVGGPVSTSELGLENGLVERSLKEGHRVRQERRTLLRAYNERMEAPAIT